MDYSKIELTGPLSIEILNSLPSYTASEEGRFIYSNSDQILYYGRSGGFKSLVDIPRDSIIIVEANTAVIGYTLLTDQNDDVLYITSGSVAGGEVGGSPKISGTWSQAVASHSHGMSHYHSGATHYHNQDHNHIISQHTHQFVYYVSAGYTYSWDGSNNLVRVQDYGTQHTTGLIVNVTDGDPASTSGNMYTEALASQWLSGATSITTSWSSSYNHSTYSSSTTASGPDSWKPLGLNFTRQQRL
jgi:hypothetical protein